MKARRRDGPNHDGFPTMIERYARKLMTAVWEPENKFRIWLDIEAHACDAQAILGVIPKESADAVRERGGQRHEKIGLSDHRRELSHRKGAQKHLTPLGRQVFHIVWSLVPSLP